MSDQRDYWRLDIFQYLDNLDISRINYSDTYFMLLIKQYKTEDFKFVSE